MDGWNTSLFKDFYDLAAEQFNNVDWILDSLVLPELYKDYSRSQPLPLNVVPITTKQFKKKLNDNHYKMVKVIADWERSGTGAVMVNNIAEDELDKQAMQTQYEFLDGDDRKSFLRECPAHVLYLWHLTHQYGILAKVRQQLHGDFVIDRTNASTVDTLGRKRKHAPSSTDPSISESSRITKNMEQIADSINGLVSVARQSQQTQQINILHRNRKELEDLINTLDSACMELELN